MITTIELKCPSCGKKKVVARETYDPGRARIAELYCPKCADKKNAFGDNIRYFDHQQNEISFTEDAS